MTKCVKTSESKTFLDLNAECVSHIFSYLNLPNILKFALITDRWKSIIQSYVQSDRHLDIRQLYDKCSFAEVKHLIIEFGPFIRELAVQRCTPEVYEEIVLLSKHFTSLETLRLCDAYNSENITKYFYKPIHRIKLLQYIFTRCEDSVLLDISSWSTLEAVNFTGCRSLSGHHLSSLSNLVDVNFFGCTKLQPDALIAICTKLKLKSLNIAYCNELNDETFDVLCNTQEALETLTISQNYYASNVNNIAKLQSLKHLHIEYDIEFCEIHENLLKEVAKHKGESLETLEIYDDFFGGLHPGLTKEHRDQIMQLKKLKSLYLCYYAKLTEDNLCEIVNSLPELEDLNITGMFKLSMNGLLSIISQVANLKKINISQLKQFKSADYLNWVEALKLRDADSVNMNVIYTSIEPAFLRTKEYQDNKHILKLTFEGEKAF